MSLVTMTAVDSDQDYLACFDVMCLLRPHLADARSFTEQARRQAAQGYRLLAAWQHGSQPTVVGVAGYRMQENLLYGRFLYVDDLVVIDSARRHGVGGLLIEAVRQQALPQACSHLVLDTGLGNAMAQRFYFRQGLLSKGMHFYQSLMQEVA